MKSGTEDLHIMPSSNGEFHVNMYGKRHFNQLRKKIFPYLSHFSSDLDKIRYIRCLQKFIERF
jgi:hypothetical protein